MTDTTTPPLGHAWIRQSGEARRDLAQALHILRNATRDTHDVAINQALPLLERAHRLIGGNP